MKNKLLNYTGYLISAIIVIAYYLTTYVTIQVNKPDLIDIFIRGGLFFVGSLMLNIAMKKQGIINGYNNELYQNTLKEQYIKTQEISPNIDKLQAWLDKKYIEAIKVKIASRLQRAGLKYEDYFSEQGLYNGVKISLEKKKGVGIKAQVARRKEFKKKTRVLESAKKVKITHLLVTELLNVYVEDDDPFKLEQSEGAYLRKESIKNVVSKILISIVIGSIGVSWLSGFSIESIILNTALVIGMLANGFLSMYSGYFFMTRNRRNSSLKQIRLMDEFKTSMNKGGV